MCTPNLWRCLIIDDRCFLSLQDYASLWQIRNALLQSRIVTTFVLQYDGRVGDGPRLSTVQAYEQLREYLSPASALVQPLDSRNSATATQELISIIQTSFSVRRVGEREEGRG